MKSLEGFSNNKESPILPGETFAPEKSLKEIRRAPRKEKSERLSKFKEKLTFQKEGLAQIQENLVEKIRENPDIRLEDLADYLSSAQRQFGLTEKQVDLIVDILGEYGKKHAAVRFFRSEYPNNDDLFLKLFGRQPKGRIEVIEGPMTLYFRCKNLDDYTLIATGGVFKNQKISESDKKWAKKTGGISMRDSIIPELAGTIIAERSGNLGFYSKLLSDSKNIHKHEERHAINRLFEDRISYADFISHFEKSKTDIQFLNLAKRFLRDRRQYAEQRARDEIFAYFSAKSISRTDIFEILTKSENEGGLYDYLLHDEAGLRHFFRGNFEKYWKFIKEAMPEDRAEYHRLLRESIWALYDLEKSGYSDEKVIGLLIYEPLRKWKKVVRRIIETEKK